MEHSLPIRDYTIVSTFIWVYMQRVLKGEEAFLVNQSYEGVTASLIHSVQSSLQ